ncbi:hypothetical protein PFISCL1PPCAC_772, partial [Pristionchus fissidentatus]
YQTRMIRNDRLLRFIKVKKVNRIECVLTTLSIPDPVGLLLRLSEICCELRITQSKSDDIPQHANYFFGMRNVEWKNIFLSMFNRKLESLYVSNLHYDSYFPR